MQPFAPPRSIPGKQNPKPIPGRGLPAALNRANIPKANIPQQNLDTIKSNPLPTDLDPKLETPEVTPKPEFTEPKKIIEKNPENDNESPEQKHPPETNHARKFSFSPNPDPEEAQQKHKPVPSRHIEEYKEETRVSQAQLQGGLKEMRELQANFGGFDLEIDNNEPEEDPEAQNYVNDDDDYVRVESQDTTDVKKPFRDERHDYEEIDNPPPMNYGQGQQDFENSADRIEDPEAEELVVEEGEPVNTHVDKQYFVSTIENYESNPSPSKDPEQVPHHRPTKTLEEEPQQILETGREDDEEDDLPPPTKGPATKPRYQEQEADPEDNQEPETKPPIMNNFIPPMQKKPTPFTPKPFVPAINRPMSQQIPPAQQQNVAEVEERHHKTVSEPFRQPETKVHPEFRETTLIKPSYPLQDASDPNLYAAYKKLELELEKERKKNHSLEKELDRILQENLSLKEKLAHQNALNSSSNHSAIQSTISQKEDEVQMLKEELNIAIENSRLVSEHSNKIISENSRYKEETDALITQLNGDKNQLFEELYSLKNEFVSDYQEKMQGFQSQIANLESQLAYYQNNLLFVEEQLQIKEESFNQLAAANSDYERLMEDLLKTPVRIQHSHQSQNQIPQATKSREKIEESHTSISSHHTVPSQNIIEKPEETKSNPVETHHEPPKKATKPEPKPEPRKEEVQKPIHTQYPVAESGGTDLVESHHIKASHDDNQDHSVQFDEEIEKPPMSFNFQKSQQPPKATQQQHYQAPQQTQHQPPQQTQPIQIETQTQENLVPPTQQSSTTTSNLMGVPQYRMPQKKNDAPHKKPIAFTPQNVQIISGKAMDSTNPLTETEEDKRETPRRENASNASTPTREDAMKHQTHQQQTVPQTKEFPQPVSTHVPQQGKVFNLATQKPKIGKNPFADPEDADLGGDSHRDEPEISSEHLVTPPTRSAIQQSIPTKVQPFDGKSSGGQKPKETKFDPTPKSKKIVVSNDAAEDFFDQLGHGPQTSSSSRGPNNFNIGQQRAFDDSHKSLHGEDPSHRESATSVHSVVSNKTDDIKPNPKVIPVAVKKKISSMANMFE